MARLRLFANLREAAGTSVAEVDGSSVSEVLDAASNRYGPQFRAGLASAKVWVNGDQADPSTPVSEGDEVALLPPVSGGSTSMVRNPIGLEVGLLAFLVLAVGVTNWISLELFAAAVVLAACTWVLDAVEASWRWEAIVSAGPGFLAAAISAVGAYRFGAVGASVAVVIAVLVALGWGIVFPAVRPVHITATNVLLSVVTAAGVGALVVLRLASEDAAASGLIVVAAGALAVWAAGRVDGIDPFLAGVVVATIASVVTGMVWFDSLVAPTAAGFAAGVGLVAGRAIGSIVREGEVAEVGPFAGSLGELDGVLVGVAIYWAVLALVA